MEIVLGLGVAAKLTGKSPDEIKALLEGKEQNEASTLFADTVAQNFAGLRKRVAADKYNQGFKEKAELIEEAFSPLFEKYGISNFETAEQGIKLLSDKLEQIGEPGTPDLSKLTPDQIADLPAFKSQAAKLTKLSEALQAKEQEFEAYKDNQHRQMVDSKALNATISILTSEKANTGSGTVEDAAQMFLATIPAERRGVNDQGELIPLDEHGQPLKDDYGHHVGWKAFVKDNYKFGFHVADPGKTGSGTRSGESSEGKSAKLTIRSQEEGESIIAAATQANDHKRVAEAQRALSNYLRDNPN